jgi:hypothetical protein
LFQNTLQNLIEKSPRYTAAKLFDFLPSCRALNNEDLFKHLLSEILIYKIYYYVHSYFDEFDVNTKISYVDVLKFISRKDLLRYST